MAWEKRKRDRNIMFAIHYEDGRTAYLTISPKHLNRGDHLVRELVRSARTKARSRKAASFLLNACDETVCCGLEAAERDMHVADWEGRDSDYRCTDPRRPSDVEVESW